MKLRSPIFAALAAIYEESQAGRTGLGARDIQPTFEELCTQAGLSEGEAFELAVSELKSMDGRLVELEWDHPRARTTIHKVRLSPRNEAGFYTGLDRESPTARRERWSALFREAAGWPVGPRNGAEWQAFCDERSRRAVHWENMDPFQIKKLREGRHLLKITHLLLDWQAPPDGSLIRWVSSHLCGHSKTLETAQKSRETLLREASGDRIGGFKQHGIFPMPRTVCVSGPLRLRIAGRELDCSALEHLEIPLADLQRAELLDCAATRCLTVENKTVFLDLARKHSGELLIWTSFPNAATLALLALLPRTLEFHHFGDTDPSGFHILDDLCRRSQLPFQPFRMHIRPHPSARQLSAPERQLLQNLLNSNHLASARTELCTMLESGNVGSFEQEEHQPAPLSEWPFYTG